MGKPSFSPEEKAKFAKIEQESYDEFIGLLNTAKEGQHVCFSLDDPAKIGGTFTLVESQKDGEEKGFLMGVDAISTKEILFAEGNTDEQRREIFRKFHAEGMLLCLVGKMAKVA